MNPKNQMWLSTAAEGIAALGRLVDQQARFAEILLRSDETLRRIESLMLEGLEGILGPRLEVTPLPSRVWAPGEIAATLAEADKKELDKLGNPPVQCPGDTNREVVNGISGPGNRTCGCGPSESLGGE